MATAKKLTAAPLEGPVRLKLYEIPAVWNDIQEEIIDAGGELSPELEARLDAIQGTFETKAESYCYVITELERAAEAAKAEAARLAAMAKARTNAALSLRERLKVTMQTLKQLKIKGDRFSVLVLDNPQPKITWTGAEKDLPLEFTTFTPSLDGKAAHAAHAAGEMLPEGFTVVTGTQIRIT